MASFGRELDDRAPGGEVSEERREQTQRAMAEFAGGLRSREAEINGRGSLLEQNINKHRNSIGSGPDLEPREIAHLQGLLAAGADEAAFHLAFDALRDRASASDQSLSRIAAAYTGNEQEATDRDTALGAIETHFYQRRRGLQQAQQNGAGARSAG
jgi:hypothetical protein